ncbi:hypothetical protein B0F90DRAFT_411236 [Multifurca ochricompacta]|uniref:DUF6533 domain-containing protein n=1 Tax=Multifurca ochricompacta TaxID=376703 RepID=A0AAD4M5H5_9AGAM|nr:hypothetical protein B0F90DRAFT_411236 [Multifurca ochricompacta]
MVALPPLSVRYSECDRVSFLAAILIPMSSATITADNLRIAALSIAAYDYLWTLSAEWRYYRMFFESKFRLSTNMILFVLIRYLSVLLLSLGSVGSFSHSFTSKSCNQFYLIPPIMRVAQSMVSQAILGLRAYTIAGRNPSIGIVLLTGYVISVAVEWFANLYHRFPLVVNGDCNAASISPNAFISTWLFYLGAILYDILTLAISMAYLLKYRANSPYLLRFVSMMIYDGLGYFVALTAINVVNAVLFRTHNTTIQLTSCLCSHMDYESKDSY